MMKAAVAFATIAGTLGRHLTLDSGVVNSTGVEGNVAVRSARVLSTMSPEMMEAAGSAAFEVAGPAFEWATGGSGGGGGGDQGSGSGGETSNENYDNHDESQDFSDKGIDTSVRKEDHSDNSSKADIKKHDVRETNTDASHKESNDGTHVEGNGNRVWNR